MKKKIFTLLTLLLCVCSGAWADPVTIFNAADEGWSAGGVNLTTGTTTVGDITWYGRGNATLADDIHNFSDGVNFTKAIRLKGKSTYKSGSTYAGVFTYTPSVAGTIKVYCKGSGASSRHVYITQSAATSTENDPSIDIGGGTTTGDGTSALYAIAEASVEADKAVVVYCDADNYIYGMTFEEDTRPSSDLTVISGKETIILTTTGSYTLTKGIDYTTSSTGSITYSSNSEGVATISNTGLIEAKTTGTTTITLNQAADATYRAKIITFTVNVVEPLALSATFLKPTGTLDLSDADAASSMLNKNWKYDRPYFGNNNTDNYMTFTIYSAYSSKSNETWIEVPTYDNKTGGKTDENWDANGAFKGSASYSTNAAATGQIDEQNSTTNRPYTYYSFRIKGVSKVQVRVKGSAAKAATLAGFEITGDTPASTTMNFINCTGTSVETLTLNLDDTKEYLITINNSLNKSNSRFYEMALFYDKDVQLYEAITPAYEKSTYVTTNAVDFTQVGGITAYVATGKGTNKVVMTPVDKPVPAKTPLMLVKKSGTTFNVPVATSATAPTTNYLVASTGDGVTFDGTETNQYILYTDGLFHLPGAGTLAAGKAYLDLDVSASRVLSISFSDDETTGIEAVNVNTESNHAAREYYNLNGQRVTTPRKGLYIVNGKKVMVK